MDGDELTVGPEPVAAFGATATLDPPAIDHAESEAVELEPIPWWWPLSTYPGDEIARPWLRRSASFAVVAGCCLYIFWAVHPELILRNTTPTGGDMGAHVWGPAYLRDVLLPHFRLSGWSPDWYTGFPAYTFYMVVPSLAIVALDVGFIPWQLAPLVLVAFAGLAWYAHGRLTGRVVRALAFAGCALGLVLSVDIPYNIAFKLVSVSGLVLFPAAVWFLASGLGLRWPGPELLAIATVPFLMDESLFHILGGNIASTMAGEFAFSISLTAGVFFLGVAARGFATGRHRAWGAVLFALCLLCHVIPAIYVTGATAIMLLLRLRWVRGARTLGRFVAHPAPRLDALVTRTSNWWSSSTWTSPRGIAAALRRPFAALWRTLPTPVQWLLPSGIVGGLIASFWYLPFYGLSAYLNDMGWEKYGRIKDANGHYHNVLNEYLGWLLPFAPHAKVLSGGENVNDPNMLHGKVFFALAAVGVILSFVLMVRAGIFFTLLGVAAALGFWLMPQHRFWNARVLPLYYLCIYLLAGIGVWLVIRSIHLLIAGRWSHPPDVVGYVTLAVAAVGMFFVVAVSLQDAPGGHYETASGEATQLPTTDTTKTVDGKTIYYWGPFKTTYSEPSRGWAQYNYQGYEGRTDVDSVTKLAPWTELSGIRDTMNAVGKKYGCGRTFWEYEPHQDRFGTPMALMLLPYWTKSCIGSMEGLYFEASSTTPFHFIVQSELSSQPSQAQRFDIFGFDAQHPNDPSPYHGVDFDLGVQHLQTLGVRYFMAYSDQIKNLAAADPRLTKIAETNAWQIYQVADSQIVTGLSSQPAVWSNVNDSIHSWAKPAVTWFQDPSQWDVLMASSGPASWERVKFRTQPAKVPIEPAEVTNIVATRDTISFDVDQVGKPVLVKTSFFPDWHSDTATGPYRVAPNEMVVIPTSRHVVLSYGRSSIEIVSSVMSLVGIVLLLFLIRAGDPEPVEPFEFLGDRDDQEPPGEDAVDPDLEPDAPALDGDGPGVDGADPQSGPGDLDHPPDLDDPNRYVTAP